MFTEILLKKTYKKFYVCLQNVQTFDNSLFQAIFIVPGQHSQLQQPKLAELCQTIQIP